MKQVLVQGGSVVVHEVPTPQVSAKNILVRVQHSCVSVGTEMASVKMSGLPLYKRALKQPDNVKRVLEMVREQGIKQTLDRVQGKLAVGSPTGYSAAGTVIAVGSEVVGFQKGDRVACAGAGIANHAEVIDVPVNLAVKIPDNLGTDFAATVTLGAIAMQGVRRANPTLGETVAVLGLGILGQLTVQMLVANGCHVIGSDLDASRIEMAKASGMEWGISPQSEDFVERVHKLTEGFGADAVIITAATASNEVMHQAMQATRRKGRIVLVGDVGLNLNRGDMYQKELDFFISTSYGPGRYDPSYEEGGQDYPIAYVRWTENRNMEQYLNLIATGKLTFDHMAPKRYSIDHARDAYESLKGGDKPLVVLLEYPETAASSSTVTLRQTPATKEKIKVALVGAGAFAQGMHIPNMTKLKDSFELHSVMSRTGSNAMAIAKLNSAKYATTDYEQVLNDPEVDLLIISTRHNLHAPMVLQGLKAGKNVFVEKPLTITREELDAIQAFYDANPKAPLLMTGFNRRFSPPLQRAREILATRTTPMIVNYRMNAGYIPLDHWVHGAEGAGRNIGEGCHLYDLFNSLTQAKVLSVDASSIQPSSKQWNRNDNFVATIRYDDGSICNLIYTALGNKAHPKEQMEIFCDNKVITMDDYKSLKVTGGNYKEWTSTGPQKGHIEELTALAKCLQKGGEWPIALWDQIQTTDISLQVESLIGGNR